MCPEDHIEQADNQSLSILVVDDNMINIRLISATLVRNGHQVDSASNGQEAVDKFKANNYDVILMDIMMPVMDGETACRIIRELEKEQNIEEGQRVRIIAITANAFDDDQDRLLEVGMDEMLNKPVDFDELQRLLLQ